MITINNVHSYKIHKQELSKSKSIKIVKIPIAYNFAINQSVNIQINSQGKGYSDIILVAMEKNNKEYSIKEINENKVYVIYHSVSRDRYEISGLNTNYMILPINIGFTGIYLENYTAPIRINILYKLPAHVIVSLLISLFTLVTSTCILILLKVITTKNEKRSIINPTLCKI